MSNYIIKLHDQATEKNYYLIWSSASAAPVTHGMHLEEFRNYYIQKYGDDSRMSLDLRLKRVNETGTSERGGKLSTLLENNRAGDDKVTSLTEQEIIKKYCNKDDAYFHMINQL